MILSQRAPNRCEILRSGIFSPVYLCCFLNECISMDESTHFLLLWALRATLLAVITWLCTNPSKWSHVISHRSRKFGLHANYSRSREVSQNVRQIDTRPCFRVDEKCQDEACGSAESPRVHGFQYCRDTLLSRRQTSIVSQPASLRRLKHGPAEYLPRARTVATRAAIDADQKRGFLQSFLQFRALKQSPLQGANWLEWNDEARKILSGALLYDSHATFAEVYDQMMAAGVMPDEETFSLLIRCSILSNDPDRTRRLINHMRDAGFSVPLELKNDLNHISARSVQSLNPHAPVFVPRFDVS